MHNHIDSFSFYVNTKNKMKYVSVYKFIPIYVDVAEKANKIMA